MKYLTTDDGTYSIASFDTHWVDVNNLSIGLVVLLEVECQDGSREHLHYHPGRNRGIFGGLAVLMQGIAGAISKVPYSRYRAHNRLLPSAISQLKEYLWDGTAFEREGYYSWDRQLIIAGHVLRTALRDSVQ